MSNVSATTYGLQKKCLASYQSDKEDISGSDIAHDENEAKHLFFLLHNRV